MLYDHRMNKQHLIIRDEQRIKQTGEIFTPLPLVDEILSKLPQDVWEPSKTFIDPSCGDGAFLVRVVAWKIWKGSTPKQALQTTYGVELMEDNVSHARDRILTNAFMATKTKNLLPYLSYEDEREIGLIAKHDPFARKYNSIVKNNIVCCNAFEWDFENWCCKIDKQQQILNELLS